jgi:O-antigen ligase
MAPNANLSHNFYLMFFSDMGLPGLLTAISLTAIYFIIGVKTVKTFKNEHSPTFYLVVALFASGASIFTRVLSDSIGLLSYGTITSDLPFWLVFMSLLFMYNSKLNEELVV